MKKVFFFMALAVAGLAMTACGGNKEDDKKADEAIATDSKAFVQALDNVMKATDDTKAIAAYDEFEKIAKDLMVKYKDNKEGSKAFEEACNKELKEIGYDVNDIRNIMMEMREKVNYAKMNIENGALMDEPGDMNEDMDHDMPDEMDINMDMED